MLVRQVKGKLCNFDAYFCGSLYSTFKTSFQPYMHFITNGFKCFSWPTSPIQGHGSFNEKFWNRFSHCRPSIKFTQMSCSVSAFPFHYFENSKQIPRNKFILFLCFLNIRIKQVLWINYRCAFVYNRMPYIDQTFLKQLC